MAKVWLGFWTVLVAPSPKFHCQEAGDPVEVSVNCTACPATGELGVNVKEAVRVGTTVTVRLIFFEPVTLVALRVTE